MIPKENPTKETPLQEKPKIGMKILIFTYQGTRQRESLRKQEKATLDRQLHGTDRQLHGTEVGSGINYNE